MSVGLSVSVVVNFLWELLEFRCFFFVVVVVGLEISSFRLLYSRRGTAAVSLETMLEYSTTPVGGTASFI